MTGEKNAPYAKLNQWLSNLPGYALNGVDSTDNVNAPVPLYFGDLLHTSQAGGMVILAGTGKAQMLHLVQIKRQLVRT